MLIESQRKVLFDKSIPVARRQIIKFLPAGDVVGDEPFIVQEVQGGHRGEEDDFCRR